MASPDLTCRGCGAAIKEYTFQCRSCGAIVAQEEAKKVGGAPVPLKPSRPMLKGCVWFIALPIGALFVYAALNPSPRPPGAPPVQPPVAAAAKAVNVRAQNDIWAFPSDDRAAILAEVRRRIAIGTPDATMMATTLMTEKFGLGPVHNDPELRPIWDEAKAAYEKADAGELADGLAAQADHWRHEVDSLPSDAPASVQEILGRLTTFETAAQTLGDEDQSNRTASSRKALSALRNALTRQQTKQFPMLRNAYAKLLRETTWENNVEVHAAGGLAYRTLVFTGAVFADNGAKAQMERSSEEVFQRLRFSKIRYEWYKDGDGATYTLRPIPDTLTGYWAGGSFTPIVHAKDTRGPL